jgi:hypothetical protein
MFKIKPRDVKLLLALYDIISFFSFQNVTFQKMIIHIRALLCNNYMCSYSSLTLICFHSIQFHCQLYKTTSNTEILFLN